jgi:hypothetical protein
VSILISADEHAQTSVSNMATATPLGLPGPRRRRSSTPGCSSWTRNQGSAAPLAVTHRYNRTRCLWLEQFQIAESGAPLCPLAAFRKRVQIVQLGAWLAASNPVRRSGTPSAGGSWLCPARPSVTGRVALGERVGAVCQSLGCVGEHCLAMTESGDAGTGAGKTADR